MKKWVRKRAILGGLEAKIVQNFRAGARIVGCLNSLKEKDFYNFSGEKYVDFF